MIARPRGSGFRRGLRAEHGYSLILLLILTVLLFASTAPDTDWARGVLLALAGSIVVLALAALNVPGRSRRLGMSLVPGVVIAGELALATGHSDATRATAGLLAGLLICVVPVLIVYGIGTQPDVTFHSVLGATSVYLLIGIFFAFAYDVVHVLGSGQFFAQTAQPDRADFLYFSFVTLTTVGFGDLTAAGSAGRTLAVTEAVMGQLYLVVVLALIVAGLAARRSSRRAD